MKKLFILDTNVLMHDPNCLMNFEEHDILIPITVLEELDKHKKGNDHRNHSCRQAIRTLDKLFENANNRQAVSIGPKKGKLSITFDNMEPIPNVPIDFNSPDNKILSLAYNLSQTNPNVIFVTKDINLRMKAYALNIKAQDYENDKVADPAKFYNGYQVINNFMLIESELTLENFKQAYPKIEPIANEYFLLKNESLNYARIVRYDLASKKFVPLQSSEAATIKARNLEQSIALDILLNPNISLVTLTGTSGAGKTLLALAAAIEQRRNYTQILLTRPIVPLGNDIGFLPGDIMDKLNPYMQPLFDNIDFIRKSMKKDDLINKMRTEKKIDIVAMPYLRGRSLPDIFFIVDEAQNLSPLEIKTIVTRVGEGTKLIFTGDINQIDSPYLDARSNGLSYLINKMKGQDLFANVKLQKGERSRLAELASNIL